MRKTMIGIVGVLAVVALLMQSGVFAAALTAARDTPSRSGSQVSLTMASNVIIYAGSLVCVNSAGKAVPAADSASYAVVGRASKTVDNRTAVFVATATIAVDKGVFRWANADAIAVADIGKIVYVTDDQTVNKTGGGQNIIAGTVVDVDGTGVWIDTAKVGPIGAATPSSLAVSGAATVGDTLAVTGATDITGAFRTKSTANIRGAAVFSNTVSVAGTASFLGALSAVGTINGCPTSEVTQATATFTNVYRGGILYSHDP